MAFVTHCFTAEKQGLILAEFCAQKEGYDKRMETG